jgi:hypothetical protein
MGLAIGAPLGINMNGGLLRLVQADLCGTGSASVEQRKDTGRASATH